MRTPIGVASQRISVLAGLVSSWSWGPGAHWASEQLPAILGSGDDVSSFDPSLHPLVESQWRRWGSGMRTPAVGLVMEMLVPAVLEQRVTGLEARRAWRTLVTAYGEPAPGPVPPGMYVVPTPAQWRLVPSWAWHRAGVDGGRSATVLRAAAYAGRLEQCVTLPPDLARQRLEAIPGVGQWTSAEVAQRAFGDADAVSFGDFHLAKDAVFALTGRTDGTDEHLAELLTPWPGHRGRVVRLLTMSGISRPARGPRYSPHDFRST